MSAFKKSHMTVNGNNVQLSMPFAKVDKAQRLVYGFATLDNIDSQNDVVLAEASAQAFARARGNIREMHQPIAVGRMVDFYEKEFFQDGKFYRGIFVTAYVSEGAEDTWKKVLDGTLTGFSIGGEIKEASNEIVPETGQAVRFIKDYDLVELSLVDNPANQLANIFSIQKSATGSVTVKGMVTETSIENVFICSQHEDEIVVVRDSELEKCPMCGEGMENAGWIETGANRTEKVQEVVTKFLNPSEKEAAPISESEGGVEMAKKDNEEVVGSEVETPEVEPVEEAAETEETPETEEAPEVEEKEEAADSPEEVEDDTTEISKRLDELNEAIKESLEKNTNETAERYAALESKIDEVSSSFQKKASELESKMDEFAEKLSVSKNRLAELEGKLEKMNASDAVKKSLDSHEVKENNVQKTTSWNGAFSGRPSGFSVDNL